MYIMSSLNDSTVMAIVHVSPYRQHSSLHVKTNSSV